MNTKTKWLFISIILSLLSSSASAQCNVESENGENSLIYNTRPEKVYSNPDLENGLHAYFIGSYVYIDKQTSKPSFYLTVDYGNLTLEPVKPRRLLIELKNGQSVNLIAEQEKSLFQSHGSTTYRYTYNLTKEYELLLNSSVTKLVFIDSRSNYGIEAKVYPILFSEMFSCLLKRIRVPKGEMAVKTLENGVDYSIYFDAPGTATITEGSYVSMQITTAIGDSIMFDSYASNNGLPLEPQKLSSSFLGVFMDGFKLLTVGDCAFFRVPVKIAFDGSIPPFTNPTDKVVYHVKIFSIKAKEEYDAERE